MNRWKPLIYLGVFLALGLAYYFFEFKGGQDRQEAEALAKKALLFSPDSVERFTVTSRGQAGSEEPRELVVERGDQGWRLVRPIQAPADSAAVSRLLAAARDAEAARTVEDSAAELSVFGLEPARLTLELELAGRQDHPRLMLGSTNPTATHIYAAASADPRKVLLLNSWVFQDLDQPALELRDKRLLHLDPARVSGLELEGPAAPEGALALRRQEEGWRLTLPREAFADRDSVMLLIEALSGAEAKRFIDTPGDPAQYGFVPAPRLAVRVLEEGGEASRLVEIGAREDSSGWLYARRSGAEGTVYLVEQALLERLTPVPETLVDLRLVRADREEIGQLAIESPAGSLAAERDTSGEWSLTVPERAPADRSALDNLLWNLKDLRSRQLLAQASPEAVRALEQPFLTVRYRLEGRDRPRELKFARAEADSLVWAASPELPGVALVEAGAVERLAVGFDELRDRGVVKLSGEEATGLTLESEELKLRLERDGEQWKRGQAEVQAWQVQNLLWDLSDLKFTRVLAESGADRDSHGLKEPALRVTVERGKAPRLTMAFGDSLADDQRALRVEGDPRLFAVEGRVLRSLLATAGELAADSTGGEQ